MVDVELAPGVVRISDPVKNTYDPLTGGRGRFRCTVCDRAAGKLGVSAYEIEGVGLELMCFQCAVRLAAAVLGCEEPSEGSNG